MSSSLWPHGLQHAAPMSITISRSLLGFMFIKSVKLSNHLILCHHAPFSFCLQSFRASGSFPMSWLFTSGDQSIGTSASATVLPMNIQDSFPLGLTSLISLQSKELSRVFSSTTILSALSIAKYFKYCPCTQVYVWVCVCVYMYRCVYKIIQVEESYAQFYTCISIS